MADKKPFDFGLRLKQLRKDRGLTQKEVASILNVNPNMISWYETNVNMPSTEKCQELAILYHTSLDYLFNIADRANIYVDDLPEEEQELIQGIVDLVRTKLEKNKK